MAPASGLITGLIDWRQPWLAPYAALGAPLAARIAGGQPVAEALNGAATAGAPRFVAPGAAGGEAYECYVARSGCVPTREHLHDFLNGLVWLHFPLAKRRINQLHAAQLALRGAPLARGPLRDALTLFDENAALLTAPAALTDALRARDWHGLFVTRRALWQQARLLCFGHALIEKLLTAPYKGITAHVCLLPAGSLAPGDPDAAADARADALIAQQLEPAWLAAKPFLPLPVLGLPGWWPANTDPAFYDDPRVFRPPRGAAASGQIDP